MMTLSFARRLASTSSSRGDAIYWLLRIDALEGVTGRREPSPSPRQLGTLWNEAEAASETGSIVNGLSEDE